MAPLVAILAFVGSALVLFPMTPLVAATAIVFGPLLGTVYTLIGTTLSGAVTFAIGRLLARDTVRRLAGPRLNQLSRRLCQRGLFAVVVARLLPIGPYAIVNIVAGAAHIRWRHFVVGTVIGLLPGVAAMSIFVDRAAAAIRDPGPETFALLAIAAAVIVALVVVLGRMLRARVQTTMRVSVPYVHGS